MNSFVTGIRRVTGFDVTLEGVSVQGNTDTGILREACHQAAIPAEILEPQIDAILEAMGQWSRNGVMSSNCCSCPA